VSLWLKERELARLFAKRDIYIRDLKTGAEARDAYLEWNDIVGPLSDEIEGEKSARLMRRAKKFDLPEPDGEGHWTQGFYSHNQYLTAKGRAFLRAEIRREQREGRERWVWWIPLVFGLLGSITGLASVLVTR